MHVLSLISLFFLSKAYSTLLESCDSDTFDITKVKCSQMGKTCIDSMRKNRPTLGQSITTECFLEMPKEVWTEENFNFLVYDEDRLMCFLLSGDCSYVRTTINHRFTTQMIRSLKETCVNRLPDSSFKGITGTQLNEISPEGMKGLKNSQAEQIDEVAWMDLTIEQVKNLKTFKEYSDEGLSKEEIAEKLKTHPCHYLMSEKPRLKPDVKKNINFHCVEKVRINSGYTVSASVLSLALVLLISML